MGSAMLLLDDVEAAFEAVPTVGVNGRFGGRVLRDHDGNTHIQGLAPCGDYLLLTHSDRSRKAGRLLVVRRQAGPQELAAEYCLPIVDQNEPYFFHAGGCQLFGQCLVVPMEARSPASVVIFLDISDPFNVREVDAAARVFRNQGAFAKKAGAVGVTTFMHNNAAACLLAVHDRGEVDFYWTAADDFPRGFRFLSTMQMPKNEREHQAFCLLSDTKSRVYAIGLNRKAVGEDRAVLYGVDFAGGTLMLVAEKQLTTTGGNRYKTRPHFRWGGGVEVASSTLVMSCTSHRFDNGCHINMFDPRLPVSRAVVRPTTALKPRTAARGGGAKSRGSAVGPQVTGTAGRRRGTPKRRGQKRP